MTTFPHQCVLWLTSYAQWLPLGVSSGGPSHRTATQDSWGPVLCACFSLCALIPRQESVSGTEPAGVEIRGSMGTIVLQAEQALTHWSGTDKPSWMLSGGGAGVQ